MDPAQRRMRAWIALATLLAWAIVIVALQRGGRPDPPSLRAQAILLDGPWRFHVGDDPRWADPQSNDHDWEVIDLTATPGSHDGDVGLPDYVHGWMAHGHSTHTGYAWYRRVVSVPAGTASWDILGPTLVEDGYELYWNGQLLGGSGKISAPQRVVGTRPMQFALPAGGGGSQGVVAVRVFMLPHSASAEGGGLHTPPMLAPRPIGDALHRVQWERTVAGYIVDAIEPLAMFLLAGMALWCLPRSSRRGFVVFAAVALVLMAARRLNNAIVAWTDLMDLPTYSWLARFMWIPAAAAWAMAWNRWVERPWRWIDVAAVVLAIATIVATAVHSASVTNGCRLGFIALFFLLGARIIRSGPMRILALATLGLMTVSFFGGELLDPLGTPGIWFPFGIGVSRTQYLYAALIPLLAILIASTLRARTQWDS